MANNISINSKLTWYISLNDIILAYKQGINNMKNTSMELKYSSFYLGTLCINLYFFGSYTTRLSEIRLKTSWSAALV